jgi:hypothetical protein
MCTSAGRQCAKCAWVPSHILLRRGPYHTERVPLFYQEEEEVPCQEAGLQPLRSHGVRPGFLLPPRRGQCTHDGLGMCRPVWGSLGR